MHLVKNIGLRRGEQTAARVFYSCFLIMIAGLSFYGAPGEIRTPDLLVRSQLLYPAELRARPHVSTLNHSALRCT